MVAKTGEIEITDQLKRIEELLALVAKTLLAERLSEIFDDRQHRLLFEQVGLIPVKDLVKKTKLSAGTISGLWQRWERAGLLVKDGKHYRRVI
jgi:hypothetical protein